MKLFLNKQDNGNEMISRAKKGIYPVCGIVGGWKMKFAAMFENPGFPGAPIASAIDDYKSVLKKNGHEALIRI